MQRFLQHLAIVKAFKNAFQKSVADVAASEAQWLRFDLKTVAFFCPNG